MNEILANPEFEFLRPLVTGWLEKLEAARRARSKWQELADECMMFYSKSAAAMWDPQYSRKFWQGVSAPKFRITINKAFEYVAVVGPNLMWEVPHRNVESKRQFEIPPELMQADPQMQQLVEMLGPQQAMHEARDKTIAHLMQSWLNYTPREQPGGLYGHSSLAIIDSLIKGRGVMVSRPYRMPESDRTLTGSFRIPPEDLLTDPDYKSIDDAKWISIKHVEPHWEVERRFRLPAGSLKGLASLESSWQYGELKTSEDASMHRAAGLTNDLIVWYEIYSKTGPGSRMTGMHPGVKDHLERTVGDYAYICVSANVPYPLNCSSAAMRGGMKDEQVRDSFRWPVPLYKDNRWPVLVLDHYPDPDGAWPIPPLAPAMGELKFINFLVPWLANRIYSSSRDFWAIAGPHVDHYTKYLKEGGDQVLIPTPLAVEDVRKAVQILQQPETRMDAWRIYDLVSEIFDKRTGLTEFVYGRNEGGTQNRTAEETQAKARAVGVRPEHMQKGVAAWQGEIATNESILTHTFVTAKDVAPLMGPIGSVMWQQYITSMDMEQVVRQMAYTIAASSIRRPNRDRDVANFQQVVGIFAPVMQAYGQTSGNFQPFNFLMKKWAEFHDADLDGAMIPPPPPPDPMVQQMQQMQMEMEMAKIKAEVEGKQIDMQAKMLDGQIKQQLGAAKIGEAQQQLGFKAVEHQQQMRHDQSSHLLDILQDRQKFTLDLSQTRQLGELKIELARAAARTKQSQGSAN